MSHPTSLHALIMAGGSGTRLWPLSRQLSPKQFLPLHGSDSMLAATAKRLAPLVTAEHTWVIAGAEQAKGIGYHELQAYPHIVEPCARNTAPAIAVTAAYLADFSGDPLFLILPADHVIQDVPAFHKAIAQAMPAAEAGHLVTFGITPTHPETGYGYIKAKPGQGDVLPVEKFIEKPDLATATQFVKAGHYTWNSGMFLARASVMLREISQHLPDVAKVLEAIRSSWTATDYQAAIREHFAAMPNVSIDYGVMEKSTNVMVVPVSMGWSDVGSWAALYDITAKDADGNALQAPVIALNTHNTLVSAKRLVATIGVEDLCIVDTADALLIARRDQTQRVKDVVDIIKQRGGQEHFTHKGEARPWGNFTVLEDDRPGYKVKRIEVLPGGILSLQSHKHRSEHWVVVTGTATVTCNDKTFTVHAGESTYMPVGCKHRLENKGTNPLQLIEVQVGEYLGEDDIQRYEDVYGRS